MRLFFRFLSSINMLFVWVLCHWTRMHTHVLILGVRDPFFVTGKMADREEVSLESDQNSSAVGRINVGREGTTTGYITLDEQVFVRDPSPFLKGCSCIACVNHTRSYVHHLINANEILAEILIFNHNLHHLLKMFEQISLALEAGSLDKFQRYIESQLSE